MDLVPIYEHTGQDDAEVQVPPPVYIPYNSANENVNVRASEISTFEDELILSIASNSESSSIRAMNETRVLVVGSPVVLVSLLSGAFLVSECDSMLAVMASSVHI